MTTIRRGLTITGGTVLGLLLLVIAYGLFEHFAPDSWRYRDEIARTEKAAALIEAYRVQQGRYPAETDKAGFEAMDLHFDDRFQYSALGHRETGRLGGTMEAPLLIFHTSDRCHAGTYDLARKKWDFLEAAC